jgi:hypothetical protein
MDYHTMDIIELRYAAKALKIKQYYIKKRAELIQILSFKELPQQYILEKKTILELRSEARLRGLAGITKMPKRELLDILYPSIKK